MDDWLLSEVQARRLVERLGGRWTLQGGMCLCPAHADKTPSLSVRLGDRALLFKCFAGCNTRDVMRALRHIDSAALSMRFDPRPSSLSSENWHRRRALQLWQNSQPISGSLAAAYLRQRGIAHAPPSLRFHPCTPLGRGKAVAFRPAMLAAVRERGRLVAVHRTFLGDDPPGLAPDLLKPRRMLGHPRGGAVMLFPATHILGLAEGLETAMSAMALLDIPVWATLGSERLHRIILPSRVTTLVLLADKDRAGHLAAERARAAYACADRTIMTIWPPGGRNDWNDVHRKEGRGGGTGSVRRPDGWPPASRRLVP